jgi:hypothetical protein
VPAVEPAAVFRRQRRHGEHGVFELAARAGPELVEVG